MSPCGKVFAGGKFSSVLFGTPLVKCTFGLDVSAMEYLDIAISSIIIDANFLP